MGSNPVWLTCSQVSGLPLSGSPRQLPVVRKPGVAGLGYWVHVLNVSIMDEEERLKLLSHMVVLKEEGRKDCWVSGCQGVSPDGACKPGIPLCKG